MATESETTFSKPIIVVVSDLLKAGVDENNIVKHPTYVATQQASVDMVVKAIQNRVGGQPKQKSGA